MFKNKVKNRMENVYLKAYNIHYSRIIASWVNVGGKTYTPEFKAWLKSIKDNKTGERVLTDEQVDDIYTMANDGKLEWEMDARRFMCGENW